jgi:hypothetical protein
MGLLDIFAKTSRLWEVHFLKKDGSRESSGSQDRSGAIGGITLTIMDAATKLDRVTYAGKPVSQTGFEDLVADAHLFYVYVKSAEKQGLPLETMLERGLDKAQMNSVSAEIRQRISKMLGISEVDAAELIIRRLSRGMARIAKQQIP